MKFVTTPPFLMEIADNEEAVRAAQRLRYEVFVEELGGGGELVDHENRLEMDRFDPFFDHLILRDKERDLVAGVYRVMRREQAEAAGGFYSSAEYDLSPLLRSERSLLELGRSCLHRDYRGGPALFHLWSALAQYIEAHQIELLFGVASFHGVDPGPIAAPLSLLHHRHLAPEALRVRARDGAFQTMDLIPEDMLDRRKAMMQMPSLIKSYLRIGGVVGEGAFVDHAFNTTDVCLILDTRQMNERQAAFYRARPT